jgi:hypothetical protein
MPRPRAHGPGRVRTDAGGAEVRHRPDDATSTTGAALPALPVSL